MNSKNDGLKLLFSEKIAKIGYRNCNLAGLEGEMAKYRAEIAIYRKNGKNRVPKLPFGLVRQPTTFWSLKAEGIAVTFHFYIYDY